MKVLSVQQPWASLIAAGIKTVENRTWQPKQLPGRILIHASKKTTLRLMNNEPLEWVQEIFNGQLFGNIPDFPDMPGNALIGYVNVERIDKDNAHNIWAAGESGNEKLYYWHLTDAHLFDEPIINVKGKLWLWDYDLDENNLPPAHKVEVERVIVNGDNVSLPLSKQDWDFIHPNGSFAIELGSVANELCKPEVYDLIEFKTITFRHKGQQRTFALKPETESRIVTDDSVDPNPIKYLSILNPDGAERWLAYFIWGEEI